MGAATNNNAFPFSPPPPPGKNCCPDYLPGRAPPPLPETVASGMDPLRSYMCRRRPRRPTIGESLAGERTKSEGDYADELAPRRGR